MTDDHEAKTVDERVPRVLIIGAGSRGNAYARVIFASGFGVVATVADPIASKRQSLGSQYIWSKQPKREDAEFASWQAFIEYEEARRERQSLGQDVLQGVDAVFICTLDHTHREIITALSPFGLHIMCEKPLATSLQDCIEIYQSLRPKTGHAQSTIFSIGHVLRYSPHNVLLRKLLLEDRRIGDTLSMEHTEPVGWSHFSHSYVRGNWRKESISAPSLLTKACHDIDLLLWLLCSPEGPQANPHLPYSVSSTGSTSFFKRSRKPKAAGAATNCLTCAHEPDCIYSAKKIYFEGNLQKGNAHWPVNIVDPEIEDLYLAGNTSGAKNRLINALAEDYTTNTSSAEIERRPWYGRCVWESDNDVCDNQVVTIDWEDENTHNSGSRSSKTASLHMVAFTELQCHRRGRIYGTEGEIEYDSFMIRVYNFATAQARVYRPEVPDGGHGGGDRDLANQFVKAVADVINGRRSAEEAQLLHVGCSLDDIIRSHAFVFAAEEARLGGKVINWKKWWEANVLSPLEAIST